MKRLILCNALAAAGGAIAIGSAVPVFAAKTVPATVQIPIQIIGADSACASWIAGVDTAGGITLTCNPVTGGGTGTAPTGCVATVNGQSSVTLPNAGGAVNLAASCSTPASGITYSWTRNGVSSATTASWSETLPANTSSTATSTTSYQVQACNGSACVTAPTSPLTASVPPAANTGGGATGGGGGGGGGTGAWNGTCPGFSKTLVLNMNWANSTRLFTSNLGGFMANDALVVVMTTGSMSSPNNNLPRIAAAEWASSPSTRQASLSATPCDFGAQSMPGGSTSGNSVTIPFAVGAGANYGYYPSLQTNTTYYFNIKNAANPACGGAANCDIAIDLTKPSGM